jgi:hypothetical protein
MLPRDWDDALLPGELAGAPQTHLKDGNSCKIRLFEHSTKEEGAFGNYNRGYAYFTVLSGISKTLVSK